jgi:hypothetical protein
MIGKKRDLNNKRYYYKTIKLLISQELNFNMIKANIYF